MGPLAEVAGGKRVLLAVASPAEVKAVASAFGVPVSGRAWEAIPLDDRFELVITHVSKAAAAGAVARVLDPSRHGLVLSVGIAGTLSAAAPIGGAVVATRSELVDDGVQGENGFEPLEKLGFGPFPPAGQMGMDVPPEVLDALRPLGDVLGPIATVSVCSGTDTAAARLAAGGFVAEAMEGAAVALVAAHLSVPFGEVRVISNTTGDRSRQRWDMRGSLERLAGVFGRLRTR